MGFKIGLRHIHGILLFLAQLIIIMQTCLLVVAGSELFETPSQRRAVNTEPFRMVVPLNAFVLCQIVVEVVVAEISTVVTIHGDVLPFQFKADVGSMRLLFDALVYALLCITYFQPSVMACNLRRAVGIHHPDEGVETMYFGNVHHIL